MKNDPAGYDVVRCVAAFGNVVFFLWFFYNGVDSGFAGTRIEVAGWICMFALLAWSVVALFTLKPALMKGGTIGNVLGVIGILCSSLMWGLGTSIIPVLAHLGILSLLMLNTALLLAAKRCMRQQTAPGSQSGQAG